ncbi:MAG: nucleoside triphosphate pyrophosphohydrolase [Pseudomonadota bacterium]
MISQPPTFKDERPIDQLLAVMRRLRDPENGCPWDVEQTFQTIAPYTLEEAYEVVEAIESGSMAELCDELGDLLLQVVFHAQMAAEQNAFAFDDVVFAIINKMIRRHPHIFGSGDARSKDDVRETWEAIKSAEKGQADRSTNSALNGVAVALPALVRAQKIGKRAARTGFDWETPDAVLRKLDEELGELADAREARSEADVEEEFGDVLFTLANLARHLNIDGETALRRATLKFEARFKAMEATANNDGASLADMDPETLERRWVAAKSATQSE